ncbi:MAG: TonB-dependent receptor domain-containing protein [Bryobacteraceae bacterium]
MYTRTLQATLLALFCLLIANAQTPTGAIEGAVTDASGAAVQGANVTITSESGQTFRVTTGNSGLYSQQNLDPGKYTVRIEAAGFTAAEIRNIDVKTGSTVNGNAALQVGTSSVVVEVAAQSEAVDTARQTVDTVITTNEIRNLPLFGRNFLDLAILSPGTVVRDGGAIDPTKSNTYKAVGIAGRSGTATRVQIDGIDITDETVGTTTANYSQDAVAEFEVSRSSLDLSTSLTSSGAINIISKTGTNQLHGTAFFDFTNNDLSARQNYNTTVPDASRKRFGGGAGGPLWKDRLFVYGNLEKSTQVQGQIVNNPTFPQYSATASLPLSYQLAFGSLDYNITSSVRAFYRFSHSDDLSTGGSPISPFQNVDWTNVHILGLTAGSAHLTHNFRFGYVNFNNHIDSSQLAFPFPNLNGYQYQLNINTVSAGPNGLAPQQTYQDNYQWSYEGSYLWRGHSFRYGADVRRIVLGGFANFAGPLAISAQYDSDTLNQLKAQGLSTTDPLNFPLQDFATGPNAGFFTVRPADNLPHGGHLDTRTGLFVQDSWKATRSLTINFGVRWQYDTGFFADPTVKRDPNYDRFVPGGSQNPVFPKNLFSPSFGFAWDVTGKGKTVLRGGFYRAYEMNIFNNTIFDEASSIPAGIGPDGYTSAGVNGPDGKPINVANHPTGDYSDLVGQPLRVVLPIITQVDQQLKAAYANYNFNPNKGIPVFTNTGGTSIPAPFPGNQTKIPYSLQFNIGVQHEIRRGLVVTADFLYNHGIGLPILIEDYERRRDASILNVAAARSKVAGVLGAQTADQYIASHPGVTISKFGLGTDAVWPGRNPDFTLGRFTYGGFTKYAALQFSLRGQLGSVGPLKDNFINVAYSRGYNQSTGTTGTATRAEFRATAADNHNPNDSRYFGPTGLDYRHILTIANISTLPFGFRINTITQFRTAPPNFISVPGLGAVSGSNFIFGTDLNGDGGTTAASHPDLIPGLDYGEFGRDVGSFSALNKVIQNYNSTVAGHLTPAGQALVSAGIFTEAQLRQLGAVSPVIPQVSTSAPNPFHSSFTTDARFDRPIKLRGERINITPFVDFFNLFNHAPRNGYGNLNATFGSFNFDYTQPGQTGADLALQQGRLSGTRQIQFGIRADF